MKLLQDMADGLRTDVIDLLERQWGSPLPPGALARLGAMAAATDEAFELAPIVWRKWPANHWGRNG